MNDLKIQNGKPVDENIRPIMVDGKTTSMEISQSGDGAKITGDLEVTGEIKGKTDIAIGDDITCDDITMGGDLKIVSSEDANDYATFTVADTGDLTIATFGDGSEDSDLTLDVDGSIILNADDGVVSLFNGNTNHGYIGTAVASKLTITTSTNFDLLLNTNGTGDINLDSGGDITLDPASGNFIAKNNGTEFSPTNSSYAGMILGYTVIGLDATPSKHDVLDSMTVVHDDLKVAFVFPPSGKVEIFASIYVQTAASRAVTFGLSTADTTGYASLGVEYENHTFFADETDGFQHGHRWYVTGTPGDAEELWFAAGATQAGRIDLYWGGDSSAVADSTHPIEYQPFVMKATALPATIYTG